jgi:hypothetical protein
MVFSFAEICLTEIHPNSANDAAIDTYADGYKTEKLDILKTEHEWEHSAAHQHLTIWP